MKTSDSTGPVYRLCTILLAALAAAGFSVQTMAQESCSGAISIARDNGGFASPILFDAYPQNAPVRVTVTPSTGAGSEPMVIDHVDYALACNDNLSIVPCAFGNEIGASGNPPIEFAGNVTGSCGATSGVVSDGVVAFDFDPIQIGGSGCTVAFDVLINDIGTDSSPYFITPAAQAIGTCLDGALEGEARGTTFFVLFEPAIEVTKTGPEVAKVGDAFEYEISFEYTGSDNVTVENCTGFDALLGGDLGQFLPGVPRFFDYTPAADDPSPLVNTVEITCDVVGLGLLQVTDVQVSDFDDHQIELIDPAIEVTKSAGELFKLGDEIIYTIGFENVGSGGLGVCTGTDTLLGDLGEFEAGVYREFGYTPDSGGPVGNSATITCDVAGFDNQVEDADDHTAQVIDPAIEVTKSAGELFKLGDEIIYTIGFENVGSGALGVCTGTDTLLGDLGEFEAGVYREFGYTPDSGGPVENTATITCDVAGFDNQVSDWADHTAELVEPAVSLVKQCQPDPVLVGEDITWILTIENTGTAALTCELTDETAGILESDIALAPGASDEFQASRLVIHDDYPLISNTAELVCDVAGFDNQVSVEDTADCEVELPGEEVCRTPGFWGTHGGTEHPRATNLTQLVIDAGGPLSVCGRDIDNTAVGNQESALEAMCVRVQGVQQRQLARQLTAMALNCIASGGNADCTGTGVDGLYAAANGACEDANLDPDLYLGEYIERVDCFNNGGTWDAEGEECSWDGSENCQDRELDAFTDIFDSVHPFPGPAGSSRACNAANNNNVYVVPVP